MNQEVLTPEDVRKNQEALYWLTQSLAWSLTTNLDLLTFSGQLESLERSIVQRRLSSPEITDAQILAITRPLFDSWLAAFERGYQETVHRFKSSGLYTTGQSNPEIAQAVKQEAEKAAKRQARDAREQAAYEQEQQLKTKRLKKKEDQ